MTAAIRLLQRIAHTLACQLASHLAHSHGLMWTPPTPGFGFHPVEPVRASSKLQADLQSFPLSSCQNAPTPGTQSINLSVSESNSVQNDKVAKTRPHLFAQIGRVQASSAFSPIHHFAALDDTSSASSFSRKVKSPRECMSGPTPSIEGGLKPP